MLLVPVTALAFVTGPTSAAQTTSTDFASFVVRATAVGVTVRETAVGAVPAGTDVVVASSSLAEAELTSTSSSALGALPYPTDQVLSLPGAVAGLGGVPAPPNYPLAARADYPFTPDASATPPGQPGATVSAHAEADAATGVADGPAAADTTGVAPALPSLPGGTTGGPVYAIGGVHNRADAERAQDGSLRVTATSAMTDVSLLGGAFHAAEISTTSTVTIQDGKATPGSNDVHVGGATLGGAPVTVGRDGLVVGPQTVAVSPLVAPLADALVNAGIRLTATPSTQEVDGPNSRLSSGSLTLAFGATVSGFPLTYQIELGGSDVVTQAVPADAVPAVAPTEDVVVDTPESASPVDTATPAAPAEGPPPAAVTTVPRPRGRRSIRPATFAPTASTRLDFRPVYLWLVLLGFAAVAARHLVRRTTPRRAEPGLRDLWRW